MKAPRLRAASDAMFVDLARAAGKKRATRVGQIASNDAGDRNESRER